MANEMKEKRDALKAFVETTLQAIDADFNVEDRFREDTFNASNRNARVSIMGSPIKYAEVLYAGRSTFEDSAKSTRRKAGHVFEVSVWYGYKDDATYASSSQATFDTITDGDSGILEAIASKGYFKDTSVYSIDAVEGVTSQIVAMDNTGKELAHFLGFQVNIRG